MHIRLCFCQIVTNVIDFKTSVQSVIEVCDYYKVKHIRLSFCQIVNNVIDFKTSVQSVIEVFDYYNMLVNVAINVFIYFHWF